MKNLTPRQIHILQLTAKGFTVKAAAEQLKLSRSAVEKQLISIRAKLDAKNIANAVYKAAKTGIIIFACFNMVNTGELRRNVRTSRLRQDSFIQQAKVC